MPAIAPDEISPPAAAQAEATQQPYVAGEMVAADEFHHVRQRVMLEACKWDPQVGDVSTLARFPLLMRRTVWRQLARWAEQLTRETLAAEVEVLRQPELLDELGLPRAVRHALRLDAPLSPAATRVMRFDFHFATEGWRISEVNSDVPGGFAEASDFTAAMAAHFPGAQPAGDPVAVWADAIARAADGGIVGLLAAPGYMEDQQIMAYLARKLAARDCGAVLANPLQLEWREGVAHLISGAQASEMGALIRFYQGEWLARLPAKCGWRNFFRGGRTPVGNPGSAVISESKRFPLIWRQLANPMTTWRALLPETRALREAPWRQDDDWILKSAMCNNGDDVCIRQLMNARDWRRTNWEARLFSSRWAAQRRFEAVALPSPAGLIFPSIGVYTIDGRAAGAYARYGTRPVIDYAAVDIALLVTDDE